MPFPKKFIFGALGVYLLLLALLGKAVLLPSPPHEVLRVDHLSMIAGEERALLNGAGFDESTKIFISLDMGNQRLLRNILPTWGRGGELMRVGDLAYLANHQRGLAVLDIADPLRPRLIGAVPLPGLAKTIVVASNIAYVGCGVDQGLAVVDISEPTAPRLLTMMPELIAAQGMAVVGDRLYVTIFKRGVDPHLAVVDISQPSAPRLQGRLPLAGQLTKVVAVDNILCVTAGHAGLHVLALDAAGFPESATRLPLPGISLGLAVAGRYAYVGSSTGGLTVVDLAAASPQVAATLPLPGNINHLLIEKERLYAVLGDSGGHVFDLSLPRQPRLTGYFDGPRAPLGLAAVGEIVYLVGANLGVHVLDLNTPAQMQAVSQTILDVSVLAVVLQPGLAFVTTSQGNLYVIDRTDPHHPQVIGMLPLHGQCKSLAATPGYLYAYIPERGLQLIDIRDPNQPQPVALYPHEDNKYGAMAVDGHLALLTTDDGKLLFLDFATPRQPRLSGVLAMPGGSNNIVVQDGLIAATMEGALLIIDPAEPRVRGSISLPVQRLSGLALAGRTAVAVSKRDGLLTVDLTDPDAPRLLAVTPLALDPDRVIVQGNTAYVTARKGGVQLIDLTDPAHPRPGALLGDIPILSALAAEGEYLYLAARLAGLLVLPAPQELVPTISTSQMLSFPLPPVAIGGHYTLRIAKAGQTVVLPGILQLSADSSGKELSAGR